MLDNIEQNDDIHMTDAAQVRLVRDALQHVEAGAARMLRRLRRELDAGDLEMAGGLHEKESIGASELEQPAAVAIAANELDAARDLPAQHRLGPAIIGIAVGAAAGEIVLGIVGGGIEPGCFGAAEPATPALQDIAAVDPEAKPMVGDPAAGR